MGKERQQITEEMGIHKEWYVTAKRVTAADLPEFVRHLTEDYGHDYGTICHALSAAAIAAATAVNKSPAGGITGFQAGAVMWGFIRHWNYETNKVGLRIVDYDNLLYPQYAEKFDKTISSDQAAQLKTEATRMLNEKQSTAHPDVLAHWKMLASGELPFGFRVNDRN